MTKKNILIADSGSTKTDWCLISASGRKKYESTAGMNPYFMQESDMLQLLKEQLSFSHSKTPIYEVHFYGAGLGQRPMQKKMTSVLKTSFPGAVISVQTDILGAARACCGEKEGIVCILGTGSNSCFYTGKKIGFKTPSLGYILGDEGGGTFLGKKVLQYYLHGIFDSTLMKAFEKEFPLNKEEILDQIYRQPFPNRSLATYATFVLRHRGHYMIENIAEDALNEFFLHHILRYPKVHQRKVHFTGSVAAGLKDILQILCEQYEIPFGQVIQKPIEGLARYHKQVE